jgi:hypothetical protein
MLYQVIILYLLVGILVVLMKYNYITKIALEVLDENIYLTVQWSQGCMENYVNYVMPCFFIFMWPVLLLCGEDD